MNTSPTFADLMFDVDMAPVHAVLNRGGAVMHRTIPHKRAIIHRPSGRVLGVVSSGYRIVTNQEALKLARLVCARAFPGVAAAEWEPARVSAPLTLGHANIDLHHRTHVLNLSGAGGDGKDPYTPFLRVTNSFNGTRALRFDFGFIRRHCENGVIFEKDLASLVVAHQRAALGEFDVKVRAISLEDKWREFAAMVSALRGTAVGPDLARNLIGTLLTLPPLAECSAKLKSDRTAWTVEIDRRHQRYADELGANAYAVFNVVTDFAARPPEIPSFQRPRPTLEKRAGLWLRLVSATVAKPAAIDWPSHLTALRKAIHQRN